VEFEPMDDFERELRQSFERRPAPPSLKRKIMERRRRASERQGHSVLWRRLAACLVVAAVLGGAAEWGWHIREERRQGEAARQQVLTALRITSRALDHMNLQLAAHDRTQE
jgi:hypothetical protein